MDNINLYGKKIYFSKYISWQIEQIYDFVYIYNQKLDKWLYLENISKEIWLYIEKYNDFEKIVKNIVNEYNIEEITAKEDIKEFLLQLLDEQVIEIL